MRDANHRFPPFLLGKEGLYESSCHDLDLSQGGCPEIFTPFAGEKTGPFRPSMAEIDTSAVRPSIILNPELSKVLRGRDGKK